MVKFYIQPDSSIPVATQLYNQISFAITSGQYPPGKQLPSTRQLAMWTGVHRNTISKVYQQLKEAGLVDAQPGAGVFVKQQGEDNRIGELRSLVRQTIDRLVQGGHRLEEIQRAMQAELNWRLQCAARVWVACHDRDPGVGEIMAREIRHALAIPVQVVAIESLPHLLEETNNATTIVTNPYLYPATKAAAEGFDIPIIPLKINRYQKEIDKLQALPVGTYVGIVSASSGILRVAETIVRSIRGEELTVVACMPQQEEELYNIARYAHVIFVGDSAEVVQQVLEKAKPHRHRPLEVVYCDPYIAPASLHQLRLELGLA
ncbi:MAG: GntR family transcriptional regulator [Pseudanabaenaceae cyanobacterium SKYGB_i_bin29]|nr:GntR family transcriptional regulator [Pseudanabaenaceae cyanobacterium SKYG29]MDW8420768.1 GntR family transcriptional regulator [Pseudanabaenaceae cyanobacterium SKYGB_i_bin29]